MSSFFLNPVHCHDRNYLGLRITLGEHRGQNQLPGKIQNSMRFEGQHLNLAAPQHHVLQRLAHCRGVHVRTLALQRCATAGSTISAAAATIQHAAREVVPEAAVASEPALVIQAETQATTAVMLLARPGKWPMQPPLKQLPPPLPQPPPPMPTAPLP